MFQFETLRPGRRSISANALNDLADVEVKSASLLAWNEHCVECAAPSCYSTCDLFEPTATGKCRRFKGGIVRIPRAGKAPLAEVRFKRWGKLEAQGNVRPIPVGMLRLAETLLGVVGKAAGWIGLWASRVTKDARWGTAAEAIHRRLNNKLEKRVRSASPPSAFIAEIFNPADRSCNLLLTMSIDQARLPRPLPPDQLPRPFRTRVEVSPGASRTYVPATEFHNIIGSGLPFLVGFTVDGDDEAHLAFGELNFIWEGEPLHRKSARAGTGFPKAKCVVFDLDNTLWRGILLEGRVELREEIAEIFRRLDERGILLSIASKNAADDAMALLEGFGLSEYLLHPQICWDPKSVGLRRIAAALDINIDTFIFVDDNPFERAEVEQALPQVEVLPETSIVNLLEHPRLQGAVTSESRMRRQMYRDAVERDVAAQSFDDFKDFLRSCEIKVSIRNDRPEDAERITELVQRTNQLNFSGRKYGREEVSKLFADNSRDRYVVSVDDRFGSYGTVGFCLVRHVDDALIIEDLMLSCRVQGKFIEQALFWYLFAAAGYPSVKRLIVNFKRTERNEAAYRVLTRLDFAASADGFVRDLAPGDLQLDFLQVNTRGIGPENDGASG